MQGTEQDFDKIVADVVGATPPSSGGNLEGMAYDFDLALGRSELLGDIEIERTDDMTRLLDVRCRRISALTSSDEIGRELVSIWKKDLAYSFFEDHTVTTSEREVLFRGITVGNDNVFFVSAAVSVALSPPS